MSVAARRAATVRPGRRRVGRRPVPASGSPLAPGSPGPISALSPLVAPPPPPPRPSSRPLCQGTSFARLSATSRTRLSEPGRNPIAELSRLSSPSPSPSATCGRKQPRTPHADDPAAQPVDVNPPLLRNQRPLPNERRPGHPTPSTITPALAPTADCPKESDQHLVPRPKTAVDARVGPPCDLGPFTACACHQRGRPSGRSSPTPRLTEVSPRQRRSATAPALTPHASKVANAEHGGRPSTCPAPRVIRKPVTGRTASTAPGRTRSGHGPALCVGRPGLCAHLDRSPYSPQGTQLDTLPKGLSSTRLSPSAGSSPEPRRAAGRPPRKP